MTRVFLRVADAAGAPRVLAYDPSARDFEVVTSGSLPPGAAFANAREYLTGNRAGRDGGALDFAEVLAVAANANAERPLGFAVAVHDDAAYDEWRVRAWPDDLRAASDVASPDPWERARLGTAVAVVRDETILLGKRIASYGNGAWQTPGGKPDAGERLAAAAVRELEEETGLRAVSLRYATSQVDTMPETGVTWRTHFWVARAEGDPVNREPDKCAGWSWFPLDALPSPLFAIEPRTIATIARLA